MQTFIQLLLLCLCIGSSIGRTPDNNRTKAYFELTEQLEKHFKGAVKGVVKQIMPTLLQMNEATDVSSECMSALLKYLMSLNRAKLWAARMLDASSKLPPGLLAGTFVDYGSFDECLEIRLPDTEGQPTFTGSACAVEATPPFPPMPEGYSLVKTTIDHHNGTLGQFFRDTSAALAHKKIRFVVCVPSTCSRQDMQNIFNKVTNGTDFKIRVPQCYTKEDGLQLEPVHLALIACLLILAFLCCIGSITEWKLGSTSDFKDQSTFLKALLAFSVPSNFQRLISPSQGSSDLKCIHGIRALGMCWIVLGHTYGLMDFELLKDPSAIQGWFKSLEFQFLANSWLAVDSFFLLGGILVAYGGLRGMQTTDGSLNIPVLAVRRLVRLTPPLLLLMGLVFFLPLLASGPFWYEHVDPQVDSCRNYWWTTLLYVSNWFGIDKGCTMTTWYLSVDFQLHILSLFLLLILYRFSKFGLSLLVVLVGISCAAIGVQTFLYDIMATIEISAVDDDKVMHALNKVHVYTLTHLGPHCIGMILGCHIFKYREQKLNKAVVFIGWCLSTTFCLSAVLGNHRFSTGEETSVALSVLYAAVHRSVFIIGLAWVAFACISGNGGIVNSLLSASILSPFSRLTFMVYLLHPLVIWTRLGSLRERHSTTHYDFINTYLANLVISFVLAVPFYLLLEAPLSNLDRLIFHKKEQAAETMPQEKPPMNNASTDQTNVKC